MLFLGNNFQEELKLYPRIVQLVVAEVLELGKHFLVLRSESVQLPRSASVHLND